MALTEKKLGSSTVAATEETIYTAPSSTTTIIKTMFFCNVTATDATIEVWNPTSGAVTADNNQLLNTITVPKNDFMQISTYLILTNGGTGDTIVAKCGTADAITLSLYGAEMT